MVRSVGGTEISSSNEVNKIFNAMGVGANAEMTIIREGRVGRTTVRIEEMPAEMLGTQR